MRASGLRAQVDGDSNGIAPGGDAGGHDAMWRDRRDAGEAAVGPLCRNKVAGKAAGVVEQVQETEVVSRIVESRPERVCRRNGALAIQPETGPQVADDGQPVTDAHRGKGALMQRGLVLEQQLCRPFALLDAEREFLKHAFKTGPDGRLLYPELVYSCPKKSGKTTFGAIILVTMIVLSSIVDVASFVW